MKSSSVQHVRSYLVDSLAQYIPEKRAMQLVLMAGTQADKTRVDFKSSSAQVFKAIWIFPPHDQL